MIFDDNAVEEMSNGGLYDYITDLNDEGKLTPEEQEIIYQSALLCIQDNLSPTQIKQFLNDVNSQITNLKDLEQVHIAVSEIENMYNETNIDRIPITENSIQEEMSFEQAQKSGTDSVKPEDDKENRNSKAVTQKKIMYELAEEREPIVFSTETELANFLELMYKFPNLSALNLLLLSAQYQQASLLRTFDEWHKEGHNIKKGQKAIHLFKFEGMKSDKNGKEFSNYSIKNVFDISQTDCEIQPQAITFDNKLLFTALIKGTKVQIKPVEHEELPNGHSAYFDDKEKTIYIAKDLPFCTQFNALCCEILLSEIQSRDKNYSRYRYENDCLCASYIISKKYGIDASYLDLNSVCTSINNSNGVDVRKTIQRIQNNVKSTTNRINAYIERTQGRELVM